MERCRFLWWEDSVENFRECLLWHVEIPWEGFCELCFLLPWRVVSIGKSHYWRGSSRVSRLHHCVILRSMGQMMPFVPNEVWWNCLWIPICVTRVPVVGWSCRLILEMLGILIFLAWVYHATLMEFCISMLIHFICSLQCHISRWLDIVSLMVLQRICCSSVPHWWWNFGGILSIVGDIDDAIVGAVGVPHFFPILSN